jgi:multisubunit Na+/H+ antiporter MnhG subunit
VILQQAVATGLVIVGVFFLAVGALGFLRLPDVF